LKTWHQSARRGRSLRAIVSWSPPSLGLSALRLSRARGSGRPASPGLSLRPLSCRS
jgi:hypothetical protein